MEEGQQVQVGVTCLRAVAAAANLNVYRRVDHNSLEKSPYTRGFLWTCTSWNWFM